MKDWVSAAFALLFFYLQYSVTSAQPISCEKISDYFDTFLKSCIGCDNLCQKMGDGTYDECWQECADFCEVLRKKPRNSTLTTKYYQCYEAGPALRGKPEAAALPLSTVIPSRRTSPSIVTQKQPRKAMLAHTTTREDVGGDEEPVESPVCVPEKSNNVILIVGSLMLVALLLLAIVQATVIYKQRKTTAKDVEDPRPIHPSALGRQLSVEVSLTANEKMNGHAANFVM